MSDPVMTDHAELARLADDPAMDFGGFGRSRVLALLAEIAALRGRENELIAAHAVAVERIGHQRDEAAALLRRYRADLPSEALEDITDSFLASMEPKT